MTKDIFKAKAKKLVLLLTAHAGEVQYQDALELLAQLEGFRNWKTLSAVLEEPLDGSPTGRLTKSEPNLQGIPLRTPEGDRIRDAFRTTDTQTGRWPSQAPVTSNTPKADTSSKRPVFNVAGEMPYAQDEVPGVGFIYSVPISVDTSMTARVLVRATSSEEAIDLARTLVSDGKAELELDDGNYRGPSDYYCSDSTEDGVYRTDEPAQVVVSDVDDGVQVGPYLVQVYKDFDDPTQVWADLLVYAPNDEDGPGDPLSAMTAMDPTASLSEYLAFCKRVAESLRSQFPDAANADRLAVDHLFRQLVQAS